MSQFDEKPAAPSVAADEAATPRPNDESRRFTPLKSHVRARVPFQDTRRELTLSRLVPISRLQG